LEVSANSAFPKPFSSDIRVKPKVMTTLTATLNTRAMAGIRVTQSKTEFTSLKGV
jgi:hypothetical protein